MTPRVEYDKIFTLIFTGKGFISKSMSNEHEGHRSRLIAKIDKNALEEHEWLELLLFNALPRKNTNPLAHKLLSAFGSIENIFAAPISKLTAIDGIGESIAAYLKCIGKFYEHYRPGEGIAYPSHFETAAFRDYVVKEYAHRRVEVFDVYLLNKHTNIIFRKRFEGLSENAVSVPACDIAEAIALNKPSGVILVHNHPSASCKPSKADDDTTKKMVTLCSSHDVLLCDHYVVGYKKDVYSYHAAGEMAHISKEYSINAILENSERFAEATRRQREEAEAMRRSKEAQEARLEKLKRENEKMRGKIKEDHILHALKGKSFYSSDKELPF